MKNRIIVRKTTDMLHFYLQRKTGTHYMFTQKFTRGVYSYFRYGRSEGELRAFRKWDANPRLVKTITKIPMYIKYVEREVA